jgi:3-deoxy-D-manno-octulosonic-acid transferase
VSLARTVYTALAGALLPYARVRLRWRARKDAGYAEHVEERFGHYDHVVDGQPLIWIHAVSVGETRAAAPLVDALSAAHPSHRILLTHMTPTGRRTSEALFGDRVMRAYVPYDYPAAVSRFLDHFRPRLGIIMETEIWPNLVHLGAERGVPMYLVNARLSERSYRAYRRVLPLVRATLRDFAGVAAQSEADAERLRALGASNVDVTGSLKFDVTLPAEQIELGLRWRRQFGARPVILAASTRDGEEALLIDAFTRLDMGHTLLVIVPRHPQRFADVANLLARRSIRYERRSSVPSITEETRVLLGDSMGEMAAYYAAADVAFIGGSLLPFGAQNLIEACAVGTPVVLGQHTFNFGEAAAQAVEAGAAVRVHTADEAMQAALRLIRAPQVRKDMAERALAFSRAHRGATQRVTALLESVIGDR